MKTINTTAIEPALIPGTKTVILIPANYSNDILAAGLALMMALRKVNQSVSLLSPTPARVGDSNFFDIDQLSNSVPSDNFVITLKNAVPKLKRVKHFVDGDDLKFMLFPRENVDKFDASEISFGYETSSIDLIIALGQDLHSALSKFPEFGSNQSPVLVISNNPNHATGTDKTIIDQEAKSIAEIVARVIETTKLPVWEDLAFNIFQGLYSATNNFSVANLTQNTLEVATWAVTNGANKTALSTKSVDHRPSENSHPQPAQPQTQHQQQPNVSQNQQNFDRERQARNRDRDRNRNRDRNRQQGSNYENRPNQQQATQPQRVTPVRDHTPANQQSSAVSDWESKPKIYQGSTVVESDFNETNS